MISDCAVKPPSREDLLSALTCNYYILSLPWACLPSSPSPALSRCLGPSSYYSAPTHCSPVAPHSHCSPLVSSFVFRVRQLSVEAVSGWSQICLAITTTTSLPRPLTTQDEEKETQRFTKIESRGDCETRRYWAAACVDKIALSGIR